jgi:sigma-B regulation protein RsbU (phosphoserine phosphatase)
MSSLRFDILFQPGYSGCRQEERRSSREGRRHENSMDRITRFKKEMIDLYSEVDLSQLLEKITAGIRGYLDCEEASIFIYDEEKEELAFETATGAKAEQLKRIVLRRGQGIAGWIAEKRRGVIIDDCSRDPRHTVLTDRKTQFQTRSLLGVPVLMNQRLLGVLEAVNKKRGKFSPADLRLLAKIAAFLAVPLQNAVLIRQMLEKEKIEKELQIARDIQQSFLRQEPAAFPGLDIAFLNIPSSKVGGDYYEVMPLNEREIVFSVNDIAGHGIPAALLVAVFRSSLVYQLRHGQPIAAAIGHLNRLLAETTEANLYVTSFTCKLDAASGVLEYISAGHPPPLLVRGGEVMALEAGGLAVGMFTDVDYPVSRFQMQGGDVLVLYTDGVIEAANESGWEPRWRRGACARLPRCRPPCSTTSGISAAATSWPTT